MHINTGLITNVRTIRHAHLFCGLGGGAAGFNRANPRIAGITGRMECIGGIDVDPGAIRDFGKLAGVAGTVMDLFDREQYETFHGAAPSRDWKPAGPADIIKAFGGQRPDIIFCSPPCKGFSGLLSESKSKTAKYQALNRLTVRGIWLALEAYKDDPVDLLILENVPRIATRGRHLLDQIKGLLDAYGYVSRETAHDCGALGGLAQSRKRFLLVARHKEKVPPGLFREPPQQKLRGVGEVLERLPMPGDMRAGPMHRVPSLQWQTWIRLAFVEAGSDWRSLNKLAVEDGNLRDYLIVPEMRSGVLGVTSWDKPACTVAGRSSPTNNAYSVADPRHHGDPKFNDCFRVVRWDRASGAVTGAGGSHQAVADPRIELRGGGIGVLGWDETAGTVAGESMPSNGRFAVADPRPTGLDRKKGDAYLTGGHYGVVPWDQPSGAVSAAACHDNGRWAVADPRLPASADRLVASIRALDGTWHRPFTTLELAAIQSLMDPDRLFQLDGNSDQAHRERVGNAVPADAAKAIGEAMGIAILLADAGETFLLSELPIWVKKSVGIALTVAEPGETIQ